MSNIRLANYNTGTSRWIEIPTTSSGNNSNGTATSSVFVTSTGSDDYTLGSITDLKPRAKFSPTGPVCGASGIPVTFTYPVAIPFNYTLSYTIDGVAQIPVTVTSLPYTLPTTVTGTYKLTDFTYDIPSSPKTGVVDPGTVVVYPLPTAICSWIRSGFVRNNNSNPGSKYSCSWNWNVEYYQWVWWYVNYTMPVLIVNSLD